MSKIFSVTKKLFLLFIPALFSASLFAQNNDVAIGQHKLLGMQTDTTARHNSDPRAAWFPKAGLGMFIHWGAITQYAGCDLSWGMLANKGWDDDGTVTPNYYYSLMDKWAPKNFNPEKIAKMAKAAGFEYMVFVCKHHDGYTMWPSKYCDIGVQTKMNGHDFVKEYVAACRKEGLKVGLYYSPPDWWFDRKYRNWSYNDSVYLDMDHKKTTPVQRPADHDAKRREMIANEVRELLTNYGKIDLLWFDGGNGEISNDEVRKLQPGIVINRRNGQKEKGDYGDSEGALPEKRFSGWFETCDPIWPTRWWSYSTSDSYDTPLEVLMELIKLRAWGGNLLGDVGPDADGNIPPEVVKYMQEIAVWMKANGESVHGTEGGNYPEKSIIPVTVKEDKVYAFFFPSFQGTAIIQDIIKKPSSIKLLRTGTELKFDYNEEAKTLKVSIPPPLRTRLPDVIKIQ